MGSPSGFLGIWMERGRHLVRIGKRESLIRAADSLFHRQGLEHTSLADIASAASVPLGNVYYYFKTRGDLVKAVSENRLAGLRARREEWGAIASPRERLLAWVENFETYTDECTAHGCRIGGFCQEANKQGGAIADEAASVLRSTLDWIFDQFRAMGYGERQAREHAGRMLSARQGSILLSNTFKDPEYIRLETARLLKWLGELPADKKEKKK
ncbi:MAG: TetR family transcriptional regulator [Fibrobacteres bacterium]|nr:TetR family transcriptional regulator [Fibrobacterota bacterium]